MSGVDSYFDQRDGTHHSCINNSLGSSLIRVKEKYFDESLLIPVQLPSELKEITTIHEARIFPLGCVNALIQLAPTLIETREGLATLQHLIDHAKAAPYQSWDQFVANGRLVTMSIDEVLCWIGTVIGTDTQKAEQYANYLTDKEGKTGEKLTTVCETGKRNFLIQGLAAIQYPDIIAFYNPGRFTSDQIDLMMPNLLLAAYPGNFTAYTQMAHDWLNGNLFTDCVSDNIKKHLYAALTIAIKCQLSAIGLDEKSDNATDQSLLASINERLKPDLIGIYLDAISFPTLSTAHKTLPNLKRLIEKHPTYPIIRQCHEALLSAGNESDLIDIDQQAQSHCQLFECIDSSQKTCLRHPPKEPEIAAAFAAINYIGKHIKAAEPISPEDTEKCRRALAIMEAYNQACGTGRYAAVENFFARLLATRNTNDKVQLILDIATKPLEVTDDFIDQHARHSTDGSIIITPYLLNCITLHALSVPTHRWTDGFKHAFSLCLGLIEKKFDDAPLGHLFSASSYPDALVQQLKKLNSTSKDETTPIMEAPTERAQLMANFYETKAFTKADDKYKQFQFENLLKVLTESFGSGFNEGFALLFELCRNDAFLAKVHISRFKSIIKACCHLKDHQTSIFQILDHYIALERLDYIGFLSEILEHLKELPDGTTKIIELLANERLFEILTTYDDREPYARSRYSYISIFKGFSLIEAHFCLPYIKMLSFSCVWAKIKDIDRICWVINRIAHHPAALEQLIETFNTSGVIFNFASQDCIDDDIHSIEELEIPRHHFDNITKATNKISDQATKEALIYAIVNNTHIPDIIAPSDATDFSRLLSSSGLANHAKLLQKEPIRRLLLLDDLLTTHIKTIALSDADKRLIKQILDDDGFMTSLSRLTLLEIYSTLTKCPAFHDRIVSTITSELFLRKANNLSDIGWLFSIMAHLPKSYSSAPIFDRCREIITACPTLAFYSCENSNNAWLHLLHSLSKLQGGNEFTVSLLKTPKVRSTIDNLRHIYNILFCVNPNEAIAKAILNQMKHIPKREFDHIFEPEIKQQLNQALGRAYRCRIGVFGLPSASSTCCKPGCSIM